jgi:tetratricopeptide (TPR) repeat protein
MKMSFENLVKEASAKLQSLDFGEAARLYNEALLIKPNNGAVQMGLAMVYNNTGESAKALQILQTIWTTFQSSSPEKQASLAKSTQAEIIAQMGIALQHLGQLDQALTYFYQAYNICPSEPLTSRINYLKGNLTANSPFEQLMKHAQSSQQSGQLAEAIKAYKAALQLNPDSDRAQHGLGNTLRQQGDYQAAIPFIQQAIIMQPEIAEYHNTLGMLFQQKGEVEKAITFYHRALNLEPNYAAVYCNLGVALKSLERVQDAIAAYQRALQINPNLAEVHNNLGNLLRATGDLAGAQTCLEQALRIQPNYPDAQQNLQELLELLKSTAKKSKGKSSSKKEGEEKEKKGKDKEKSSKEKEGKPKDKEKNSKEKEGKTKKKK